jgi:hypothetical protein
MAHILEREDFEDSFVTLFRLINGNSAQEIYVHAWDADDQEAKLTALTHAEIEALFAQSGKSVVKEWSA